MSFNLVLSLKGFLALLVVLGTCPVRWLQTGALGILGSWGLYGETWDSGVICVYRLQAGSVGANSLSPLCPLTAASGWNSEAAATGLEKASLPSTKVLREGRGALHGGLGYSSAAPSCCLQGPCCGSSSRVSRVGNGELGTWEEQGRGT